MTEPIGQFDHLFAGFRSAAIPDLWPWQREVLAAYEAVTGDAAIELPTGAGKTLVGLLIGEDFRQREAKPVAYLAGTKQLAQQVERQARQLGVPVVRFQDAKSTWPAASIRAYNFGQALGVMNYWNYFNASPGVDSAGLLILDDVHLLEQPLRERYTVTIPRADALCDEILTRILALCPYYGLADDLLNGLTPAEPPEMIAFPDSADLADEIRDMLDARLTEGTNAWWAWQQIRRRLAACCWLVSSRGITLTPYIPPSQTNDYFSGPARRLYLSATIGSDEDLRRRIGAPPVVKLSAAVQPRQGERIVVLWDQADNEPAVILARLKAFVGAHRKALWLCARLETAKDLADELSTLGLPGAIRILEGDNGTDEAFAADAEGHLITAGRYDGMDFPGEACRVEILPEVPVATSDLEEWTSAYLRDAAFAEVRFSQRVSQALGRCNRTQDDRAVYVLADPGFITRFMERRVLDSFPADVRADVFTSLERNDRGFDVGLREASEFLTGVNFAALPPPTPLPAAPAPSTAALEVDGYHALWLEDYGRAEMLFGRVTDALSGRREHRAFWLSLRALALQLSANFGDAAAGRQSIEALDAAASAGSATTFFTRLRLARTRRSGQVVGRPIGDLDGLFAAWDRLVDRLGVSGPRFDTWTNQITADLGSTDHDTVARAIARVGAELLGLSAEAPKATSGEPDAIWELPAPARVITFEVKLAPQARRVSNADVEQAEGATTAEERTRRLPGRGLLVTPWPDTDETATQRLDRVRLIRQQDLLAETLPLLALLAEYRRGWSEDAEVREERRHAVEANVPSRDWLWTAVEGAEVWVTADALRSSRIP